MRILIIEDDPGIQRMLSYGFQAKGDTIQTVHEGGEALKFLSKAKYEAAVVDLMLPGMGGEDVIRKIREFDSRLTIIVLTSLRQPQTKARLLELGADDFVEKPFSFDELYARIQAKQRRIRRGEPTQHLKLGNLCLIPEKRLAMLGKKAIELGNTEYRLLEYLMMRLGKASSRQSLMENVWGYSANVRSNTIDTHINRLRSKIGKKRIKTVHGIGYMME